MFSKKLIAIVVCLLFQAIDGFAEIYYVDDNGEAQWNSCEKSASPVGPKSGTYACNLKTANENVTPGDTVYLREGTYYPKERDECIHPGTSGLSGQRIIYSCYTNERVVINGDSSSLEAILFSPGWNTDNPSDGRSYITVKGIIFDNWEKIADLYYASFNEICYCEFLGHKEDGLTTEYHAFEVSHQSKHNWIHDNTWHTFGHYVDRDAGVLLSLGFDGSSSENAGNNNNTVENNHFYHAGHHVVGINGGKFNIVRNNYIHNEGWSSAGACSSRANGVCGYRVMSMTDDNNASLGAFNLLEDNNIAYGAQYGGPHLVQGASGSGLTIATDDNIVRYNSFFGNVMYGMRIGASVTGTALRNHIYNNTIHYCGYNLDAWGTANEDDSYLLDGYRCAFIFYGNTGDKFANNVVKNNLTHKIWSETNNYSGLSYYPAFNIGNGAQNNTITNNWGNAGNGQMNPFTPYPDPKFVDPDVSDPMAFTFQNGQWTGKPDLSLQDSSPVINNAAHLTQADGSDSNATTLIVDDALYFQDGTWGSDLARGTFFADWIAIGNVWDTVQISSVNYASNTLTLSSPMTWGDNDKIWLYKKSDGTRVLYGHAPDFGAHESRVVTPQKPLTPTDLDIQCHQ